MICFDMIAQADIIRTNTNPLPHSTTMTPITITVTDAHTPSQPLTPKHVAVTVTITATDSRNSFAFEYQYNPKYSAPTEADFAHALLLDAEAYDENPFTFAHDLDMPLGTPAAQQTALHAWQECRKAAEFMSKLTQQEHAYITALAAEADD